MDVWAIVMLHVKLKKKIEDKSYAFVGIMFAFVRRMYLLVLEFSSIAGSVSTFPR